MTAWEEARKRPAANVSPPSLPGQGAEVLSLQNRVEVHSGTGRGRRSPQIQLGACHPNPALEGPRGPFKESCRGPLGSQGDGQRAIAEGFLQRYLQRRIAPAGGGSIRDGENHPPSPPLNPSAKLRETVIPVGRGQGPGDLESADSAPDRHRRGFRSFPHPPLAGRCAGRNGPIRTPGPPARRRSARNPGIGPPGAQTRAVAAPGPPPGHRRPGRCGKGRPWPILRPRPSPGSPGRFHSRAAWIS